MKPTELFHPTQRLPSKAYLVNELRKAIYVWREQGYPKCYYYNKKAIAIFLLGGGTNVLIRDEGVRGMVIKLNGSFKNIERNKTEVKAGAGCSLSSLISYCQEFSLKSLDSR